jgi:hypothetical protein
MDRIANLGTTEHLEIYKIIQSMSVSYSENNNGIFFNLTTLPEEVIKQIDDFVNYCYENKTELDEYDQKLNECKYRNNINIINNVAYTSSINEPIDKKEKWKELIESIDKTHIVKTFIDKISNNMEKHSSKRGGTKFLIARKKYSKKMGFEIDLNDNLYQETYETI